MQSTKNSNHRIQDHRIAEFPTIAALRLTEHDLEELAEQGFVCEERRGNRTYYKLRFRRSGQQVVRYIGGEDRAVLVKQELSVIQLDSSILRELNAKTKIARKSLREAKRAMEPVLKANGFVFHGLAIRRPRRQPDAIDPDF
jgi:DNA-binding transcriptional ArsR family regulator